MQATATIQIFMFTALFLMFVNVNIIILFKITSESGFHTAYFILSGPAFTLWSAPASGFHTGVRVRRPRPVQALILHLVLPPDRSVISDIRSLCQQQQ